MGGQYTSSECVVYGLTLICYHCDMKNHRKLVVIAGVMLAFLAVAVVSWLYLVDHDAPAGMRQVKSYRDTTGDEVTCKAISPECGVCLGDVINQKCYVKKGMYEQDE